MLSTRQVSKLLIVGEISRNFDPLTLIAPSVILAKMLQILWSSKLSWNKSLPLEILNHWHLLREQLPNLQGIKVQWYVIRCLQTLSWKRMGLSPINKSGKIQRNLSANNKMAPLKCPNSDIRIMCCLDFCPSGRNVKEVHRMTCFVWFYRRFPLDKQYLQFVSSICIVFCRTVTLCSFRTQPC